MKVNRTAVGSFTFGVDRMLLYIPLSMLIISTAFGQNYVPGLTRQPSSFLRPPLFRFKRPPPKNFNVMETLPSETNSRLTHPASEPFIPGATAFIGRRKESLGDFPLNPRPQFNNFEFSPPQEDRTPVQDVALDGENLLPLTEGSSPPGLQRESPEEQGISSPDAPYDHRSSEHELSEPELSEPESSEPGISSFSEPADHSEHGNEFIHPKDEAEQINDNESVFHQDVNENHENVNLEQEGKEEETPVEVLEENVEDSVDNEHKSNEEEQHSNLSRDYVHEESYVNPSAERPQEDSYPEQQENTYTEQDETAESRSKPDEFNPFENFAVDEVHDINNPEISEIEESEDSAHIRPSFENHYTEDHNEIPKLNIQSQENAYPYSSDHFGQQERQIERELPNRPSFSMRPTRFHQIREQFERQPSFERSKQEIQSIDRQDHADESRPPPSRFQYPSFNENSLHKGDSFSDTPSRIISSPKLKPHKTQEAKKRRRPYKPFLETTATPYEDDNLLADYPLYEDDNESKEPDRLTLLLQQTKFNCQEKNDGYYADESLRCEVFHFCQDKVRHSWLCPSGASFHQVHLICMPQSDDNICEKSSNFHFVNDYLYKEAPESTGRNRSYVQRYYPKGYEGGIAVLEERQSISQNPSLHQALPPYEREQVRPSNVPRSPPRNYHPQHSVQSHETAPIRRHQQQQDDVHVYDPRPLNPPQEDRFINQQQHYDVSPILNTRQDSIPFANNPTQGHIRRPQEIFPRPGAAFLADDQEPGLVKRAPSFHRRLGPF